MRVKHLTTVTAIKSVLSERGKQIDEYPGNFVCAGLGLTSLEGSPSTVHKNFNGGMNFIESLEHSPRNIGGGFYMRTNVLTSLEGGPIEVGDTYNVENNVITSLKGAPSIINGVFIIANNKLKSLAGGPRLVNGNMYCSQNKIETLEGFPSIIGGDLYCDVNSLKSLQGIHKIIKEINGDAHFENNPIKSHVLGLLRIRNLRLVGLPGDTKIEKIINKHLKGDRDIFACQAELVEEGFEEFAQL